jgi:hypothetical protein
VHGTALLFTLCGFIDLGPLHIFPDIWYQHPSMDELLCVLSWYSYEVFENIIFIITISVLGGNFYTYIWLACAFIRKQFSVIKVGDFGKKYGQVIYRLLLASKM